MSMVCKELKDVVGQKLKLNIKENCTNENYSMFRETCPFKYKQNEESFSDETEEENIDIDISHFKDIEAILNSEDEEEGQEQEKIQKEVLEDSSDEEFKKLYPFLEKKRKESRYKLVTRRIDNNRIRHKSVKNIEVFTSAIKNVKMDSDGPIRSGAIIYTHFQGKTYFALGQDSVYGDLTDFSGGKKQNETIIEGGLRELEEESLGVFGKMGVADVKESTGFYSNNMLIMFIHLNVNMQDIVKEFNVRLANKGSVEVNGILWLEKRDFIDCINGKGRRLYSRVRRVLSKVVDILAVI